MEHALDYKGKNASEVLQLAKYVQNLEAQGADLGQEQINVLTEHLHQPTNPKQLTKYLRGYFGFRRGGISYHEVTKD